MQNENQQAAAAAAPAGNRFTPEQVEQLRDILAEMVPSLVDKALREKRLKYDIVPLRGGLRL